MRLIKKATTSYVNATKRWGHDFTRNREGNYSNPWANSVKPNVNTRTHKNLNYPFCLIHPIIYFFQKLVGVVNSLRLEDYGIQIRMGKSISFWENKFLLMGQENTHEWMLVPFFTHVLLFLIKMEQDGHFFLHDFYYFPLFTHTFFSPMQLEIPVHFSFMFSVVFLIFHD